MIPHIIHYCWFGNSKKPGNVMQYINKWKGLFPDYQFIEWNEKNFPVDFCNYTKEAYALKKYAFVSDVARLYGLYNYGGIYLDTDVEVLKRFDDHIDKARMVFSLESDSLLMTGFMAGEKESDVFKALLGEYSNRRFIKKDGTLNTTANTVYLTEYMKNIGMAFDKQYQVIGEGIHIYDHTVFGAFNADTSTFDVNEDTVLIHHCLASWENLKERTILKIKKFLANNAGGVYQMLRLAKKKK